MQGNSFSDRDVWTDSGLSGNMMVVPADRGARSETAPPVRSCPLLVLAAPAAVAVWSGWVGIGQMTGFGVVRPLPGILDSLRIDTAITLPLGVEAYAAIALRAWLTGTSTVSLRTRRFARWSAIASLLLGMTGQVAYHLLTQSRATQAPWEVTTLESCLPVLVLGFGTALAHLLHADAATAAHPAEGAEASGPGSGPGDVVPGPFPVWDQSGLDGTSRSSGDPVPPRLEEARAAAATLLAAGRRVSRRALRSAGVRGSNAELGALARLIHSDPSLTMQSGGLPAPVRVWPSADESSRVAASPGWSVCATPGLPQPGGSAPGGQRSFP
jgi:hypothetical protein